MKPRTNAGGSKAQLSARKDKKRGYLRQFILKFSLNNIDSKFHTVLHKDVEKQNELPQYQFQTHLRYACKNKIN